MGDTNEKYESLNLPDDIMFNLKYGYLKLKMIKQYPQLIDIVEEKNMDRKQREIFGLVGKEEFLKLDENIIEGAASDTLFFLDENKDLRTAEEIMPKLYEYIRENIIYSRSNTIHIEQLGETFKKKNPDLYLDDDAPEAVKAAYYNGKMDLQFLCKNIEYFEGKKVKHVLMENAHFPMDNIILRLYEGEDLNKFLKKYKPIMEKILANTNERYRFEIKQWPKTKEERDQIMRDEWASYFTDLSEIKDLQTLKLLDEEKVIQTDEILSKDEEAKKIIDKYGIDKLIECGVTDIKDMTKFNLKLIKEEMKEKPLEDIYMGEGSSEKIRFINKYGIDKLIALDDETGGMFTKKVNVPNIIDSEQPYLYVLSVLDENLPELKEEEISYNQLKDRMYEILANMRELNDGTIGSFLFNYDFIQGDFRKEYNDIFIDVDDNTLKSKFYKGRITAEDIKKDPKLKEILQEKSLKKAFNKDMLIELKEQEGQSQTIKKNMAQYVISKLSREEFFDICEEYGEYLDKILLKIEEEPNKDFKEILENSIRKPIEKGILDYELTYNEDVPEFFKQKYPEMFLDKDAPSELKLLFYDADESKDNNDHLYFSYSSYDFTRAKENITFKEIGKNLDKWEKYLKGKNLERAFPRNYKGSGIFEQFSTETLLKLSERYSLIIQKAVNLDEVENLKTWYDASGGRFLPSSTVIFKFPIEETDKYYTNSRKWGKITKMFNCQDDEEKIETALKMSYALGIFEGSDSAYNTITKMLTDIPINLSEEEYNKVEGALDNEPDRIKDLFKRAYKLDENGTYYLSINKQDKKEKDNVEEIREVLEMAELPKILTPKKAKKMFSQFKIEYNPDFVKFFVENKDEILSDEELYNNMAKLQNNFEDFYSKFKAVGITTYNAKNYLNENMYENINPGNEPLAKLSKERDYNQYSFEELQSLYEEGKTREFSSIPRVEGEKDGYTYEMLRLDDPLTLLIGDITDCCQALRALGDSCMKHSMLSKDGRILCVRDIEGKIVAQSWVWRNKQTICFDNIEIPKRFLKEDRNVHYKGKSKKLTQYVLDVYKQVAEELMKKDEQKYKELLEEGLITQEEYKGMVLERVTVGEGYNDIREELKEELNEGNLKYNYSNDVQPKPIKQVDKLYTDADRGIYVIKGSQEPEKSKYEALHIYEDDIQEFSSSNFPNIELRKLKNMKSSESAEDIDYLDNRESNYNINKNLTDSQKNIAKIANEYGLYPEKTRVMSTSDIALIYSKENKKIELGDLIITPVNENLDDEEKLKQEAHIEYQVRKALKQLGAPDVYIDISKLDEKVQSKIQDVIDKLAKEKEEREER